MLRKDFTHSYITKHEERFVRIYDNRTGLRDRGTHTRVFPKNALVGKTIDEIRSLYTDRQLQWNLYACEFVVPPRTQVKVWVDRHSGAAYMYEVENAPRIKTLKPTPFTVEPAHEKPATPTLEEKAPKTKKNRRTKNSETRTETDNIQTPPTHFREFQTTRFDRFIRIYDKTTHPMSADVVYPAKIVEGKTDQEIVDLFSFYGYSQMYICDVHLWDNDTVKEWRMWDPSLPNFLQIDSGMYINERKLTPLTPQEAASIESHKPILADILSQVAADQSALLASYLSVPLILHEPVSI